ncbi:MAG: AAA family ATPase [Myxococcales bacterium]|nr:AAA family ATPase [Myxococcales bacterium]
MLRNVRLKRFRGFRDFSLDLDGPIAALLGGNSSGKTSLLQAVRIGCFATEQALEHSDADPREDGDWIIIADRVGVAEPASLLPLMDWRQLFVDSQGGDKVQAEIELTFDETDPVQGIRTSLGYGRNEKLVLSTWLKGPLPNAANAALPPRTRDRAARFRTSVAQTLPLAVFTPAFYGVTRHEEFRTAKIIDRALGSSDQSHIVRNLIARLDSAGLNRLNQFLSSTIGARIVRSTSAIDFEKIEHLEVTYQDSNGELELSSAGTGLTSAVALYASLDYLRRGRGSTGARSALLLLDEPEAHLHPRLQGQVGEAIASTAVEFGVQTLIATHSVELTNRIGRRRDAVLASIDRRSASAIRISSENELLRALDEFCDLTPYTSLNFLRSRRVVFHEGRSDWAILSTCAHYLYRVDAQKLEQWKEYVGVSLDGTGNVSVKGVLEKLLTPGMFESDAGAARPFRAALVLDRDAHRSPVTAALTTTKPHLESIETTWSRYSIESLFIEPEILSLWLGGLELGVSRDDLQRTIASAIQVANLDPGLNDWARGERTKHLARADKEGNVNYKAALEQASKDVSASPEVWQHGKDRMKFVLGKVRASLPGPAANRIRATLEDLLLSVELARVGPGPAPVPTELQELFAAMLT